MSRNVSNSDFFMAGGALLPEASSYVKRPADDELFQLILAGRFAYVLGPRHMGKSSLMMHTVCRVQQQGFHTATVQLGAIDRHVSIEQAYLFLIKRLKLQLKLSVDPDTWWADHASLETSKRFIDFLHDVVLTEIKSPIAIFVDELNNVAANSTFFGEFFETLRFLYEARATDSLYDRLTFVCLGLPSFPDLVEDQNRSLFSNGQRVELSEFNRQEAQTLKQGLQECCPGQGELIFDRIFYWTNGHPYLTQKLCSNVARMWDGHWNEERVDGLVERLFGSGLADRDPNLQVIIQGIIASPKQRQLLSLYRQVHNGTRVAEDEQSPQQRQLQFLGLLTSNSGSLKVRNEIYRLAFDQDWIKANTPINWVKLSAIVGTILLLVLAVVGGFFVQQQSQRATQAEEYINNFRTATSAEERVATLAQLFTLGGYEDQAQQLFFDELSPEDQVAMFEQVDPTEVPEELITVVRGIYTDPKLDRTAQDNALLKAMTAALSQLDRDPSLGAIELELEITQWLKGREDYQSQEQYQRAIDAYNVAITMNSFNPGTYFDRGLAYAAMGDTKQALADFATVLSLDEGWQMQVEQGLINDPEVYSALWGEQSEYRSLIALVPTPTNTARPTNTPLPSPTPTVTPSPLPPTSTPTNAPTATPSATATPTAGAPTATRFPTPTPGAPGGTFTLLSPLSIDDPSYGPTVFQWEWIGSVPSNFGFEVRVWREGEQPAGVHNAVLDNQEGHVKKIGENTYQLSTDITEAAGVEGQSGVYLWTAALVRISPEYADLGQQAEPARFRFAAPGGSGGGGSKDGGGGGGVGID